MRLGAAATASVLVTVLATGCGGLTQYTPQHVGRGELTLRYDGRIYIDQGKKPLTKGPRYEGLTDAVDCVPRARGHAQEAEKDGRSAVGLAAAGGTLGVVGLGGAAGFAYLGDDNQKAFSIIGIGLGTAVLGVVLSSISMAMKNSANGNALDAMNYYNDTVGSRGGSCADPPPPIPNPPPADPAPMGPAPAPAPAPAPPTIDTEIPR